MSRCGDSISVLVVSSGLACCTGSTSTSPPTWPAPYGDASALPPLSLCGRGDAHVPRPRYAAVDVSPFQTESAIWKRSHISLRLHRPPDGNTTHARASIGSTINNLHCECSYLSATDCKHVYRMIPSRPGGESSSTDEAFPSLSTTLTVRRHVRR